jgi:hypothetical protein
MVCALWGEQSGARASKEATLKVFAPTGTLPPLRE